MYVMHPTDASGRILAGTSVAAGYSGESQAEARMACLERNPRAAGSSRGLFSEAGMVTAGMIAGHEDVVSLDASVPRSDPTTEDWFVRVRYGPDRTWINGRSGFDVYGPYASIGEAKEVSEKLARRSRAWTEIEILPPGTPRGKDAYRGVPPEEFFVPVVCDY